VKVPLPAAGRRNAPTATATQLIGVRPIGKSVNIDEPSHPPAISAKYGSLEQQSLTILVHLFLLKICLGNQETTMDATRSHTAGPTKATLNASELVTVESALGGDLLKAGALSMREIDGPLSHRQKSSLKG
jgi:hypothetical protein